MRTHCKSIVAVIVISCAIACLAEPGEQKTAQCQPDRHTRVGAVRIIEDPSTHLQWRLVKDPIHPASPAQMIPVSLNSEGDLIPNPDNPVISDLPLPIIHAGDALILVQHTSRADVHLEAIALGPAAAGEILRVRLKSNGPTLKVRALSPGRATLPEKGSEVCW